MADWLEGGGAFHLLTDFNWAGLRIAVHFSLPSQRANRSLENMNDGRGTPKPIRVDDSPKYMHQALSGWTKKHRITLSNIQPAQPQNNTQHKAPKSHRPARNWPGPLSIKKALHFAM